MKKIIFFTVITTVFLLGTFTRFDNLSNHFTHVDDISVAKIILDSRNSNVIENIYDPKHPNYNQNYKKKIREYLDKEKHSFYLLVIKKTYHYLSIPFYLSYAPLQFVLTSSLLPFAENYEQIKFLGRLPSFIISLISFGFMYAIANLLFDKNRSYLILVSSALFYLSWEYVIISQLMHNYALGVLSFLIIIYLFLTMKERNNNYFKRGIKLGSFLSILIYAHYQIIMIIPAFFATLCWNLLEYKNLKEKFNAFKLIFVSSLTSALLALPAIIWIYIRNYGSTYNSWNAGPKNEFLINWNSFFDSYLYLPKFIISNFYIVSSRTISFVSESFIYFDLIFIFIVALIPLGLLNLLKDKNDINRKFGKFSVFIIISWIVFALFSKITLSPTRHSIILLPIFCLLVTKGFEYVLIKINKNFFNKKIINFTSVIISALIIILFVFNYKNVMQHRYDLFSEKQFINLINKYDTKEILIYDNFLANPSVMPELSKLQVNINYIDSIYNSFKLKKEINNIIFVSDMFPISKSLVAKEFIVKNLKNWKVVHKLEKELPVELEFSSLTKNTGNNIYLYVYSKN
tara:strand:+ start:345 stop:2063 length:1719 start_codon:yes stop_codon:yes gene_type:complete